MPKIPLNQTITRFCNSMIFGRRTPTSVEAEEQWKGEKCLKTMRHSFHRALTTCRAPLPPGKKYVAVQFLTKELIFYVIDAKGKGQEIFDEASKHLGLSDAELFGLAFYQDGEYIFIDLNLKISKYAVRSWKTHTNGISGDGQPLFILHMRIKYYVDCHLLINEKVVRHHYYLQLRENVKHYVQPISEEKSFLLAALALQADLGNFNEDKHKNNYFKISNYFPALIVKKIGEDFIVKNVPGLHKDNAGLSRGEAQVGYIKEASDPTAPHNLHFYRMRRKKGKMWGDVWLGVGDSGIHIYEKELENTKSLLSTFSWCDIAKLHFEKKKFEILSEGSPEYRRFTYFVQSEDLAKHLLWICRVTHHFHMANQTRVAELKKLELDGGKKPYREAYIYTDKLDQAREKRQNTLRKTKLSKGDNPTVNFNGKGDSASIEKSLKPMNTKMSGMPWENGSCLENGQCVLSHHSMEALPLTNGFSSALKCKSQSIPCLPDRSLTPYSAAVDGCSLSQHWCPTSNNASTTSTLMSRSSCTSNTDSTCSSLSLTSSSTLKVGSRHSNDGSHWVKCDSFEELPLKDSPEKVMQKVCISTFIDKHVRTASVYDAIVAPTTSFPVRTSNAITSEDTSVSSKLSEVKRTPSFNVCAVDLRHKKPTTNLGTQNPNRQYVASGHGRTATRIGVSSLSRDQRLPLTLFSDLGITACGSEPNLYAPMNDHNIALKCRWLQRNLNSRSEMSLNVLDSSVPDCNLNNGFYSDTSRNSDVMSRQISLPDVCNDGLEAEADFPCIPPPPAYRNEIGNGVGPVDSASDARTLVSRSKVKNGPKSLASIAHPSDKLKDPHNTSPDVLDIQQLRQRSRDLDLPLISALCNDRSLLMLPKTVPTCSRQRHLGNKDPLRFNRTTSLPNGDGFEALLVNSGRPISWHVDSSQVAHWSEVSKPCSASWDYSIQRGLARKVVPMPRTVSLDNDVGKHLLPASWDYTTQRGLASEVLRPSSMDYNTHPHYSLTNEAQRPRTLSLENGIHRGFGNGVQKPRTSSMDYNNHCHYPLANEALRPRTVSLENGIYRGLAHEVHNSKTTLIDNGVRTCFPLADVVGMSLPVASLPPSILTSFVKTPIKQMKGFRDQSSSSDSYRYDKSQMIPTKLLAGSLGSIPNGRLYQKGLSS